MNQIMEYEEYVLYIKNLKNGGKIRDGRYLFEVEK